MTVVRATLGECGDVALLWWRCGRAAVQGGCAERTLRCTIAARVGAVDPFRCNKKRPRVYREG